MQPIKPPIIDLAGYAVLKVDLNGMLGNVFTAYCVGNRRSAFRAALRDTHKKGTLIGELGRMYAEILSNPLRWVGLDTASNAVDVKERIDSMLETVAAFLMAVQTPYEMVPDIGKKNMDELKDLSGWTSDLRVAPGLGFPRRLLNVSAKHGLDQSDGFHLTMPASEFNAAIAAACMLSDLGRYTTDTIPAPKDVGQHEARQQPFGAAFAYTEQMEELGAMLLLYAVQGTLLTLWTQKRWEETSHQLAWVSEEAARTALDTRARIRDVLYTLPMHPLVSFIAHSLQTGRIATYQGDHDLIYKLHHRRETGATESEMRDGIVCAAIDDVVKCGSTNWEPPGNGDANKPITYGTLYRMVRAWNRLTDRWKGIADRLGWRSLSGDVGTVVASGADFILTDGLGYSDSPVGGLLGLRPVISIGNIKVTGFARRFDANWNVGEEENRISTSVMVVDGFQGDTCNESVMERLFIPMGMWMGESDVQVMFHSNVLHDPIGRRTVDFFEKQSPDGFVTVYYTDAAQSAALLGDSKFVQTSWDGWATGKEALNTQELFLSSYGPENVKPIAKTHFYSRSRFLHRFPVRMCRNSKFEWFNAFGHFKEEQEFDGNVLFNEEVRVTTGTGELEAIVQVAPVMDTLGAKLPAGVTDQIALKSE